MNGQFKIGGGKDRGWEGGGRGQHSSLEVEYGSIIIDR